MKDKCSVGNKMIKHWFHDAGAGTFDEQYYTIINHLPGHSQKLFGYSHEVHMV